MKNRLMKIISLLTATFIITLSFSACVSTNPSNKTSSPIYDNVELIESSASGEPCSYEELQDYIKCYDNVNFLRFEIVEQYSPDEAVKLTNESFFENSSTLYKVKINYDYLNQKEVDIEANIAKAGTATKQVKDDPLYMVGQVYAAPIINLDSIWSTTIPELTFAVQEINNEEFAYHIRFEDINLSSEKNISLDLEMTDSEKSVITSTSNNPVVYTQKMTTNNLGDFIRDDWAKRGYEFQKLNTENGGEVK